MARAISVRLDDEASRALNELEATGMSRSEAVRAALVTAASRLRDKRALAAEVAALEADEGDRTEMLAVWPNSRRTSVRRGDNAALLTAPGLN